jgi:hypothetical protein
LTASFEDVDDLEMLAAVELTRFSRCPIARFAWPGPGVQPRADVDRDPERPFVIGCAETFRPTDSYAKGRDAKELTFIPMAIVGLAG